MVQHPSPGSATTAPSVAALVSSIDQRCQQFPASIHIQTKEREEVVDSSALSTMFCDALARWWSNNGNKAPENVIVYRDGVSEVCFLSSLAIPVILHRSQQGRFRSRSPDVLNDGSTQNSLANSILGPVR